MTYCRKRAKCLYCPKYIEKKQFMVVGKLWRDREGGTRKWSIKLYWHPQCWIKQAEEALKKQPVVETRGRKKLELSVEANVSRVKILMRRAAILQRIKVEVAKNNTSSVDKLIHLGEMLNKLKEEIMPLGGIPKSWT